ncbi:MAG: hypothetical protein K2P57_00240 [Burkholderiales bacterium]|nr:hypothetical protein [Burkholderiales bacterium]
MDERTERYFVSYTGIKLPLKLVNPLEEAELRNRNTFFRGFYDAQDRLVSCQKVVYGEIEMQHRYEYHESGMLKLAEITDAENEVTVIRFDEQGG